MILVSAGAMPTVMNGLAVTVAGLVLVSMTFEAARLMSSARRIALYAPKLLTTTGWCAGSSFTATATVVSAAPPGNCSLTDCGTPPTSSDACAFV